jgi:L-ascorbate metabolism protein UlaG (beta-lactamase superfamily)
VICAAVLLMTAPMTPTTATAPGQAASGLRLTYLGAAGWEITDGKTIVLVDPYLTRAKYPTPNDPVPPDDPRPLVTNSSIVQPDTAVIDAHITRADVIVITHTHPDHTLDLPYIAKKTGATVVGTESTATLARASGVPDRQLRVVSRGETLAFDSVAIRVIPSLHGIFRPATPGAPRRPPPTIPPDATAPFAYGQHAEGGTLAYAIRIAGRQIILFGSMNFIESELIGLRPDVALIGAMPERRFIENYTPRLMKVLGYPRLVLPTHWDAFNVPFDAPQERALERLQSFIDEVKAASPDSIVRIPQRLQPIAIEPLLRARQSSR